ncbi:MAG TPA: fumarylacetoacetate hydrolase family protein [Gemmataceae bacterium]|nr:fumarylacetoacetate hydrolase family protein [Gemmataceae bacterium]
MRLCRYQHNGNVEVALFQDTQIISLNRLASELGVRLPTPMSGDLLDYLPPDGKSAKAVEQLEERFNKLPAADQKRLALPLKAARLRVPIPEPKKVILLAGNYAEHIREGGGLAVERQKTFPYFFWKPPSTCLTHPDDPIRIPAVSPDHVDWEVELGVVIGKRCKGVSEKEALSYVAGYTVCNDVSDRRFRINPGREERPQDRFFDWLHGKWHDTFLPMGPCVLSAAAAPDPQKFPLKLRVNGQTMQDSNTSHMIFPVAALVSILSSFVTLEPGDVISTGTPSGVGNARKPPVYLKPGDVVEAEIGGIGILRNPVVK